MKLIFAQGNPGLQYSKTRHNIGFMVLDSIAESQGANWKDETKYRALTAQINIEGEKALLVKPQTFYNETGLSARGLVDFYKLNPASDVLVIHDDLALPFGTVRVRGSGSDAGNNGIKSLNAHLGSSYARLRVGIWNELCDQIDNSAFVLAGFSSAEAKKLPELIAQTITPLVNKFVADRLEPSSHKLAI